MMGDYSWDNLRLATQQQQARNTRLTRKIITCTGPRPLLDFCEEQGLNPTLVAGRLRRGKDLESAIAYPSKGLPKKLKKSDRGRLETKVPPQVNPYK